MICRIFRSETAIRDLDQLATFIQQDSPHAAIRFLAAAEASFPRLAAMPELGAVQKFKTPSLADLRVWQVQGFDNFLIFCRPAERGIEVVRVSHAARDVTTVFDEEA
jgi:toxin ParE1/3/4